MEERNVQGSEALSGVLWAPGESGFGDLTRISEVGSH
jgi:hypothetical protein